MPSKECPIIFSAPMVHAILEGRKTQTRRVIKPQPKHTVERDSKDRKPLAFFVDHDRWIKPPCQPLDRLWVREAFRYFISVEECGCSDFPCNCPTNGTVLYRADESHFGDESEKWRPSIHMPRWASRITLEVKNVRVEKLQDITEDDAKAEGLKGLSKDGMLIKYGIPDKDGMWGNHDYGWHWHEWEMNPVDAYRKLWDSLNAKRGYTWETNPWVWVVSFERVA